VKSYLAENGCEVIDVGTDSEKSVGYPDFGMKVARMVSAGTIQRGILMCGTGIGMSMVANRFPHVRAALCNDVYCAGMSRRHNDSNILVMAGRIISRELAYEIVDIWLKTPFEGGRHQGRLEKFDCIPGLDG
ncbi:MAG: ribose 5-phosphate isomerase B, partial [Desulfobacterales bacterium]|nr:ribose 5-phosphate isomerase B [Desulfobacterales bacterium]